LSLWLLGNAENAALPLRVQLEDKDGKKDWVYHPDPDVALIGEWTEWNISLCQFPHVKKWHEIKKMKIEMQGGSGLSEDGGTMIFDDIRLYPKRCVPMYGPAADFTDDCKVDLYDLDKLTGDWLPLTGQGLRYEYYEGWWDWLPDFDAMVPVKVGSVSNFDISVRDRDDGFAFRFTGEAEVPADANYTFYTDSDDGSKLYIDGQQVVDNDGLHGMGSPQSGTIFLTAGKHLVVATMFENGGGEGLVVEVESAEAGVPRMAVPDEVLSISEDILALVPTMVDLSGDGLVDFVDYALFMEQWLVEIHWPGDEFPCCLRCTGITMLEVTSDQGVFTYLPEPDKTKLESNTKVNDGVNGEVEIHTSCSQPIAIGDVHGAYTITDLTKTWR
jgi:hypothetical protein